MKTFVCPVAINKAANALSNLEAVIVGEGGHDGDDENCGECRRRFRLIDKLKEARNFGQTMHNEAERIEDELEGLTT